MLGYGRVCAHAQFALPVEMGVVATARCMSAPVAPVDDNSVAIHPNPAPLHDNDEYVQMFRKVYAPEVSVVGLIVNVPEVQLLSFGSL